ncbi:transporter substrate-binding domain-containing protein [Pelomonas sp. SE-A7]|uniref:substrate-binding periplasmic protein n=1 Tax=Pelomonas sp. SE-A7 TaxID=3054953 RepID=UPI00259D031D|nr:transporter substrate-binding domain-containing protein [Pelomonas sp. SE-A7]MDM4768145.1 transporter substrate-binding domain-containing protein [Pelomonas sp. SE-A7]
MPKQVASLALFLWLLALGLPLDSAMAEPARSFVTEPFPPYTYAERGKAAGPMVAVLQAVCEELRWNCLVEVLPWRRALGLAQAGRVDGIFTVVDTPERRVYFHVSQPVIAARYTLFSRAGDDFRFKDKQGLQGRTLGAYGPSATVLALDELVADVAGVQTVIETDNRTVLRKLAAGRYGPKGLALVNESVALTLMRDEKLDGLQTAGSIKDFDYAFGLSRQRVNEADFKAFNEALAQLCRSGRTAELLRPFAVPASACRKP